MANKFLDSTGLTHLWSKISSKFLSKTEADSKYLKLSGGTLTGNLNGRYLTGTWLQTTAVTNKGSAADKIAVIDGSGWVYYRTAEEILSDIGAASAASGADPYKVGDILYTARTDLGDKWLLCNGELIDKNSYEELYNVVTPGDPENETSWSNVISTPILGGQTASDTRIHRILKHDGKIYFFVTNSSNTNPRVYVTENLIDFDSYSLSQSNSYILLDFNIIDGAFVLLTSNNAFSNASLTLKWSNSINGPWTNVNIPNPK